MVISNGTNDTIFPQNYDIFNQRSSISAYETPNASTSSFNVGNESNSSRFSSLGNIFSESNQCSTLSSISMSSSTSNYNSVSESESTSMPKRRKPYVLNLKKQKSLDNYMDTMTLSEAERILEALSDMLFGCNIAFAVVELKHFGKFIKKVCPALLPLSSKQKSIIISPSC